MAGAGWRSFAPAKLNLYLHVGPPQPDGYHPLASLVAFVDGVADVVDAQPGSGLSLQVTGPLAAALGDEPDNLVLKAARALAQAGDVRADAALILEKQLPVASGIGGGSADAAAALRVLNALWGLNASEADLCTIAAGLGSDVPACVASRAAVMTGRGEEVRPAPLEPLYAVLVNPRTAASTAAVYRSFDARGAATRADLARPAAPGEGALAWLGAQRNDLTAAALEVAPAIQSAFDTLRAAAPSGLVRLSGSGATVFALFDSVDAAEVCFDAVQKHAPQFWHGWGCAGSVDVAPTPL